MENASKALLIAGGVLIAMIIASFGVYLYGVYHAHSEKMLAVMSEKEVNEFNTKFLNYEGRELTANELVSVLNLVRDCNLTRNTNIELNLEIFNGATVEENSEFNNIKNLNINTSTENDFTEKCNAFINYFSKVSKIKKTKSDGTEEFLFTNVYYFICKIDEYNNDTGIVKKITINIKKNEEL